MAAAACAPVEILLSSLKELQVDEPDLLQNNNDRVERLQHYLPLFETFLRDVQRHCVVKQQDPMLWKLMRSIRDALDKAEKIINATEADRKKFISFKIAKYPAKSLLQDIAKIYKDARVHYVADVED